MIRIAILDDYQNVSLEMADWSPLAGRAAITVFNGHLSNLDEIVERLLPFDVVCVMRERTPLPRTVIERLPRLKLIASTGSRNAAIDVEAAAERGIVVAHTGYDARPTIEMTWALILASARQVALENAHLRAGGWQLTMGDGLHGKTLGVLGLGNIGSEVARIGLAFGMDRSLTRRRSSRFCVNAASLARHSTCSTSSPCRRITRSGRWIMSCPRRISVTSPETSTGLSMAILSKISRDG
jgi:phosphoglycerate dehydrogenase-like enzyme